MVTIGGGAAAALLLGVGEGLGDGAAEDPSALPDAPLGAAAEPEASAPLDSVTTAVTVRLVPESDPHPETTSSPAIAAASPR